MSKLFYRNWAQNRNEALPIGNGRIGAMIYGNPFKDILSLNEETLWSGSPEGPIEPYDPSVISQARALIAEHKYPEAEELLDSKLMRGVRTQTYLPLGALTFELNHQRLLDVANYRRELDLSKAIHTVETAIHCRQNSIDARMETVQHRKESFVSLADDVLVYRFESDNPITVSVSLDLKLPGQIRYAGGRICASGRCPTAYNEYDPDNVLPLDPSKESIPFTVCVGFVTNGSIRGEGQSISLRGATEVTVILSVASGFAGYNRLPQSEGADHAAICEKKLASAMAQPYYVLKQRHEALYTEQYSRTEISIGDGSLDDLPTDERLLRVKTGKEDVDVQ